ncbi:MAG TPA: hypothetical protein VI757_16085 [Bacteroidia bacterium]|nr:hypothetical protein [Bacteroidia bacterium]
MSTILIKSNNKKNDNFILKLAKSMRLRAKVLKEDDEMDLLLIKSIDEGMESGEGSKEDVKKMFAKHGIKV